MKSFHIRDLYITHKINEKFNEKKKINYLREFNSNFRKIQISKKRYLREFKFQKKLEVLKKKKIFFKVYKIKFAKFLLIHC